MSDSEEYDSELELGDMTYDQDETIQAVRDYYAFLAKMYLRDSCIVEPPPGGWPSVTPEKFRGMGKTDEVIQLFRHLLYIEGPGRDGRTPQAAPRLKFINFGGYNLQSEKDGQGLRMLSNVPFNETNIPAHVFGFTMGEDEYDKYYMDTELGVVYWVDCPEELKSNMEGDPEFIEPVLNDPYDWAFENEHDWRNEPCWPVKDFFELLKQQFRRLRFLALTDGYVIDTAANDGKVVDAETMRNMYREHGWPDEDNFRKEDCQAAILAYLDREYPNHRSH